MRKTREIDGIVVEVEIDDNGKASVTDFCGIAFIMSKRMSRSEAGFEACFDYYLAISEFTQDILAAQEGWFSQPTLH